ncbi:MAG: sigma-70 family RNA polymerase sigma factor [Chryseolinea sp.]
MERSVSPSDQSRRKILETVKAYGKRLFGFIRKKVKSDQDAEDILQDVWYQLAGVEDDHEIEQMSGWLFQVARNKIIDKYRKKKPDSLEDHSHITNDGELIVHDLLTQQQDSPETEYLRELFWEELFQALEELPENQRQVFIWNELEDMTLQEIADKTGEKLKTIISRKGYAVKHLRDRLEDFYLDLFDE